MTQGQIQSKLNGKTSQLHIVRKKHGFYIANRVDPFKVEPIEGKLGDFDEAKIPAIVERLVMSKSDVASAKTRLLEMIEEDRLIISDYLNRVSNGSVNEDVISKFEVAAENHLRFCRKLLILKSF